MLRLSQFAAPVILGAALALGAGCASEEHAQNVPISAREIGEARETISYQAPDNGTVYVYDATANKMIYSGKVDKGQMVKVDAKQNEVTIDNQLATREDLINDHKFALYFDKSQQDMSENAQTAGQHIDIRTAPPANNPSQGATITTPNNTTVTVPPSQNPNYNNNNGTTVTVPPPPAQQNGNNARNGETTVTTPNGTVVHELRRPEDQQQ